LRVLECFDFVGTKEFCQGFCRVTLKDQPTAISGGIFFEISPFGEPPSRLPIKHAMYVQTLLYTRNWGSSEGLRLIRKKRHLGKATNVHQTHVREFEFRNYGQGKKRQGHERV
jgi:hypothetical protein